MNPFPAEDRFTRRLRRIVTIANPAMQPEALAQFLESPHEALDGLRPWDLLSVSDESEFERILSLLPRPR